MALWIMSMDEDIDRHKVLVSRHLTLAALLVTVICTVFAILLQLSRNYSANTHSRPSFIVVEDVRPSSSFERWTREWELATNRILDALDEYAYQL